MNLKDTYNKIAEDWVKDHSIDTWWVEGTDAYLSFLNFGDSILDVGCGAGVKSDYLIKKGFEVTGIDFSENMIEIAKKQAPEALFLVKDINQPLDIEDKFDGVFAQAVLLHIPKMDAKNVLENIVQVLKPNGYVYIAVKEIRTGKPDEEIVRENKYGYEFERFFSYYTLEEIQKHLLDIGMKIVYETVTLSGKTNWIQVIAKK